MKKCLLLPVFILLTFTSFAQKHLPDSVYVQIEQSAAELRGQLDHDDYISDYDKAMTMEFAIDTFKINEEMRWAIDLNGTTIGMVDASYVAEEGYDKLLNKYYKRLLAKLKEADRETLRQSQRAWVAFRDKELELNILMGHPDYSGGGTIQNIIIASRSADITRQRVVELHHYLLRCFD